MASPLEILPPLVLNRICEYLDDDSEERRSLWAFSLTSRSCCSAASAQRFCQIRLKIPALDELETGLSRLAELLNPDDRNRYVRRLKVIRIMTDEERRSRGLKRQDEEENKDDWNIRCCFDMHDFCRPSIFSMECSDSPRMTDHPEAWLPLARFISQLPALKDLVWAYGYNMPQPVLAAVQDTGCRLHMHCLRLRSLVQHRDSPQPIDLDDYALATSPSLSSIVVPVLPFETDGMINYTEDAVIRLITGAAPNLAHVCLIWNRAGDSLPHREAVRLGKPTWHGFFPGADKVDELPILGSLQSLVFHGYVSYGINKWGCYTDFTNLRCLTMSWGPGSSLDLAEMAMRGDFKSLETLGLSEIEDETEQGQEALIRLLENLNPLHRLFLSGYISNEAFEIVSRHHGRALRNLSMQPYRDDESQNPLVVFSETVVQRLAEQCPNLEQIWIPLNRTRGDHRETGIYRMLSRLPRLRRAFLNLCFSVGPDEEFWDEEKDGEYPLTFNFSGEGIPFDYLREAFTNSAIDATLALSIFNLISSSGSLTYLKLDVRRKMGRNAPGNGIGLFQNVLRWFNRSWVCKRDARGRVTVRELDSHETVIAGEDWQYLCEELQYNGDDIYKEVFNDIWPRRTSEWWKDWKSLPLSYNLT